LRQCAVDLGIEICAGPLPDFGSGVHRSKSFLDISIQFNI